jgi:Protein of unknown function (DUF1761)
MEEEMGTSAGVVRMNYLAILVAGVACFLLEGVWYSVFQQPWLAGTGRTKEWLMSAGAGLAPLQYGTAFVAALVMAAAISGVTQATGAQTAARGVKVGVLMWLGFIVTTWSTEYAFEIRPLSLLGINVGFLFLACVMIGAIVGAWKKRATA